MTKQYKCKFTSSICSLATPCYKRDQLYYGFTDSYVLEIIDYYHQEGEFPVEANKKYPSEFFNCEVTSKAYAEYVENKLYEK